MPAIVVALAILGTLPRAPQPNVTLAAVGDVMLGRGVGARIRSHGGAWLVRDAGPTLHAADIVVANLECPLTTRHASVEGIALPAAPSSAAVLRAASISVVSLANNHTLDCGPYGLADTVRGLASVGVLGTGAGRNRQDAAQPVYETVGGLRFAFLSFLVDMPGLRRLPPSGWAVALARRGSIRVPVSLARSKADIVVVSLHGGEENTAHPTEQQVELAREAVGAGADLVLGHHPHRLQALQAMPGYRGRTALVAYSLGDFVFDTFLEANRATVVLRCSFDRTGLVGADVVPLRIEHCRPCTPTPVERARILSAVSSLSRERGTVVSDGKVRLRRARRFVRAAFMTPSLRTAASSPHDVGGDPAVNVAGFPPPRE